MPSNGAKDAIFVVCHTVTFDRSLTHRLYFCPWEIICAFRFLFIEVDMSWKWNCSNDTATFFHLNCDFHSRTMTNGTQESERLELIVLT